MPDGAKLGSTEWQREFDGWLAPFWAALGDARRRRWGPVYVRGLLGPGERKSVGPLAARVAPADYAQVHNFVCASCWDPVPLERVLAEKAQAMVGGPEAVLILDDTALLKKGTRSVGVARQYAGAVGKLTNCQTLVSLTLAKGEVPVGLALRLFLPAEWTDDPDRCRAVGVPEDQLGARTKLEIALAELDRVVAAGVTFGCVLADAGYGISATFRQALSARGLTWAVGIPRIQKVYRPDVATAMPVPHPRQGRPRRHPIPTHRSVPAADVLAGARWRRLVWRHGTKGPLSARFAAVRVVVADGPQNAQGQHRPGEAAWLVGEWRDTGEQKYYLTNHPARTSLRRLAAAIKARWSSRAGPPAAQGGAGARPLRGPLLARTPSPRADDAHQLRLSPTPAASGSISNSRAGEKRGRPIRARHRSLRCRQSGGSSCTARPSSSSAARCATGD